MRRRIKQIILILAMIGLLAIVAAEVSHHRKFGHFFGYGVHADVILGNSDVGTADTYYAIVWNFSFLSIKIEGCIFPSDVMGVPDSVIYRWDVQKRDTSNQRWVSLQGADTWMPGPFDGNWKDEPCGTVTTRLWPFQDGREAAWVYKDWVTTGEPIRMAIHTSVTRPPEKQHIIYTDTFIVNRSLAKSR
jgi:hypothetical protein